MYTFNSKIKKIAYLVLVVALALGLCTGCSSEKKEKQLKYRLEGIELLENGKPEEALKKFEKALEISNGKIKETEMDICFYKAEAQYKMGDSKGALATYTSMIELNESAKAYFLRGNLYYGLGEEKKALKDYEAALKKESKNYDLYIGVSEALSANGKEKEAQEYLNQALEIKGNSAYDKMQKGRINFLLGENETALKLLEEAAKGKEQKAYYYLAEIYALSGDEEASKSNMESYMGSGVADAHTLFDVARDEMSKGNYTMAIECLKTALELNKIPNKQSVMKALAIAYEKNLDFLSARDIMREYVEIYPEDEEAQRELTFLETRDDVAEEIKKAEEDKKKEEQQKEEEKVESTESEKEDKKEDKKE